MHLPILLVHSVNYRLQRRRLERVLRYKSRRHFIDLGGNLVMRRFTDIKDRFMAAGEVKTQCAEGQ